MLHRGAIFTQALCISAVFIIIFQMSLAKSVANFHSASLTEAENDKICHNFSIGFPERKEFYSPNYPNNYPNNTKCTLRITADAGHLVKLDFRDQFRLEDSATCEYDRLEVRDGPYGYSPLLGTFCGNEFPNKITSSDRYLWLQFHSDESIEYVGFRAVYEYTPVKGMQRPQTDECLFHRSGPSGIIEKKNIADSRVAYAVQYDVPIDCMWTITTDPGQKLYMNFKKFRLDSPNDCDRNFIEIYPESRSTSKRLAYFCGTTAEPQKSTGNVAYVRLFAHTKVYNNTDFILHYTAFREIEKKDDFCDMKTEFNCGDQTCVDISLKCDHEDDCKYGYDEDKSMCDKVAGAGIMLTSEHMIIILVVFFALVIAMCASISISCYNKIKERQLREQEYKERRSKEASVEATIDRNRRGHSTPDRQSIEANLASQAAKMGAIKKTPYDPHTRFPDDGDDESSDGCYVPDVDQNAYKHPNGGDSIPKRHTLSRGGGIQQHQYPYISESFESLQSDTIVAPAPPPVPMHMKERGRPQQEPLSYSRMAGDAKPVSSGPLDVGQKTSTLERNRWPPTSTESRPGSTKATNFSGYTKPPDINAPKPMMDSADKRALAERENPKANFLRGPLEAGAPSRSTFTRNPGEIGLPKFGMARVTPDEPRGPLAKAAADKNATPLATFKSPYSYEDSSYARGYRPGATGNRTLRNELDPYTATGPNRFRAHATIEASDKDSSRAESVASTLSAPDVIGKR